jgi:hypothetical protein
MLVQKPKTRSAVSNRWEIEKCTHGFSTPANPLQSSLRGLFEIPNSAASRAIHRISHGDAETQRKALHADCEKRCIDDFSKRTAP